MDLRTVIDVTNVRADWLMAKPELETDEGLETAVILSLFTDRLAGEDDELPDASDDRRGWWGDSFADVDGDQIGSHLWLLARQKQTSAVLQRARDYARAALQWLVDDGVARSVEVDAEYPQVGMLALAVTITRASAGVAQFRFGNIWGGFECRLTGPR
jgi:phage gp46-like protein